VRRIERMENFEGTDLTPLAELRMNGDQCEVVYYSPTLMFQLEAGIHMPDDVLKPVDGQEFYDAVPMAFMTSSRILVTQELPDDEWGQPQRDGYEVVQPEVMQPHGPLPDEGEAIGEEE